MPTGYTYKIREGMGFKEFTLRCARAFGALITMRDAPLDAEVPDEFKPDDYYDSKIEESKARLSELEKMTLEEAEITAEEEYQKAMTEYKKVIGERVELKEKYTAMLKKVDEWTPPTPDHRELKNFMRDQLISSINTDCDIYCYLPPKECSANEWLEDNKKKCIDRIAYFTKEKEKEEDRCVKRTEWVRALKQSLEQDSENISA